MMVDWSKEFSETKPICYGDHESDTGSCQGCRCEKECSVETERRCVKTNKELLIELRGKYPQMFALVKSYRDSNIVLKSENEKLRNNLTGCIDSVNKFELQVALSREVLRQLRERIIKYGELCPVLYKTEGIFNELLNIIKEVDIDGKIKQR